ncbi:MAG: hypothetical protein KDH15_02480 [Rhodocyclaceae bacterium]|nr:hypothetical protein [Rhodocyclaceae bacterium]
MNHRGSTHRYNPLRREIAALAARMMAEDGIQDYGFAKRKAARQLGASETEALPTNAEVEAELRAWQALYQDEEHAERLHEMRAAAISLMRELEQFRPYLTGGVLDGTAGRFSQIDIDLFADSAKDVEIHFLNGGLRYEHREVRRQGPDAPEAVLDFEWNDVPVRLSVYPGHLERVARKGTERARLPGVEALLRPLADPAA